MIVVRILFFVCLSCCSLRAQTTTITIARTQAEESLVKKWANDGKSSQLERALAVLETQVLNALSVSEVFLINREVDNPTSENRTLISPNAYILKMVVTDFGDESARGDQGTTVVSRKNEIRAKEDQIDRLTTELRRARNARRHATLQRKITELRSSVNSLTVLDKKSGLSHAVRMGTRYSLTNPAENQITTAVDNYQTNRYVPILTEDVAKAQANEDLLQSVAGVLAQRISLNITEHIAPARILEKRENEVILSWGAGSGLKVGQSLLVYEKRELFDPDSKESLGNHLAEVGRIRVTQINPKFATARIIEEKGIKIGCFGKVQNKN